MNRDYDWEVTVAHLSHPENCPRDLQRDKIEYCRDTVIRPRSHTWVFFRQECLCPVGQWLISVLLVKQFEDLGEGEP
ncbi:hypothetical protein PRBEI_2001071000 [Prionailurus iriomotensis]